MESAVACHMNGFDLSLYAATNCSIFSTSSFTLRKDPRRIPLWLISENHLSTWLSHEE